MKQEMIVDKRTGRKYIGPSSGWIPKGETNTLVSVFSFSENEPLGDLEIGTDGFVQMIVKLPNGMHIKLAKNPSQDTATLLVW